MTLIHRIKRQNGRPQKLTWGFVHSTLVELKPVWGKSAMAHCIHRKRFWIPPGDSNKNKKNAQPAVYIAKKINSIVVASHDWAHGGSVDTKTTFAMHSDAMAPHVFEGLLCIAEAAELTIVPFFPNSSY